MVAFFNRKVVRTVFELFIINLKSKFLRKEETDMAMIYANLIIAGVKTIKDVPARIKDKVKKILIDLDLPELANE